MPRALELLLTLILIALALPAFVIVALLLRVTEDEVFFCQSRVGKNGDLFTLYKFRTMRAGSSDLLLTSVDDCRISSLGRVLRAGHLDELPQLLNILQGRMSLIGPRPEVPLYIEQYPEELREIVLSVRPGLIGVNQLSSREEAMALNRIAEEERSEFYIQQILPLKIRRDVEYVLSKSLRGDLCLLLTTPYKLLHQFVSESKAKG